MDFKEQDLAEDDVMLMSLDEIIASTEKTKKGPASSSGANTADLSLDDIIKRSKTAAPGISSTNITTCKTDLSSSSEEDEQPAVKPPAPRFVRGRSLSPSILQRSSPNNVRPINQRLQGQPFNNHRNKNFSGFKRHNFKPYLNQKFCNHKQFCPNQCRAQMRLVKLKHDLYNRRGVFDMCDPQCVFGTCGPSLKRSPSCGSLASLSSYSGWSCAGLQDEEPCCHSRNGGGYSGYPMNRRGSFNGFRRYNRSNGSEGGYVSDSSAPPKKKRVLNPTLQLQIKQAIEEFKKRSPMVRSQLIFSAAGCQPTVDKTELSLNARFSDYYAV
ncbi:Hypothetical protein NTJ_06984 [Nesidiocoris tenuis]|uniref:Uncharacterized protein n=1 Tax=Nesidiocoris tenuis TaxID=355587 RepID=A0ABN7APM9_9HEMI|nr:Hypothetical protein NTJ_06984 [Nesidiocoris tenuis]